MSILRVILISVAGLVVTAAVVGAIVVFALPGSPLRGLPDATGPSTPLARYATSAPVTPATTPAGPALSALADPAWVTATARKTGIPPRALAAYAGVAISFESRTCGIGWNTLAGIGEIESRHGTIFGGTIAPDGKATPAIFGVPLSGGAVANIPDSDKGAIDGDATIDRAVGPMQLIPEAWRNWHADGNADGVQDPQNIDDATLAAAGYLCRAGDKALDTESGWRQAVLAYNGSQQYLDDVIRYSTGYAADVSPAK
ncbi:lytic transglycosylase domain-containing protein [Lacisediminihabitans sp. FW035]